MQLTFLKSSLPFVLAAMLISGQPGTSASQQPTQQSAAKESSGPSVPGKIAHTTKAHHRVVRKRHTRALRRNGAKRAAYRPEYTQVPVEVITGNSTLHVMFDKAQPAGEQMSAPPGQMKVDIINGTTTDTQYFYDNGQKQVAARNQPVVVDVQSSDTRIVGGNKHPVVTSITAVGRSDAKSANSGGEKVTTGVSPQPKRPEYQPETH